MTQPPAPPARLADIDVPHDAISTATWAWAHRALPEYIRNHSIRVYFWAAAIARLERWSFDPRILWTASLMHDLGLTRLPRNTMCFEVEGAEVARRFLERRGMSPEDADRVAIAIILHMRPSVMLEDGVESVLLDRSTAIDVRGEGYELIEAVRDPVVAAFPRGAFDRHFLAAITRETVIRPTCQSARLLKETGLAGWMARSPWAPGARGRGPEVGATPEEVEDGL
jgi:cyanamide hydratase family protein with HD domain